MSSVQGDPQSSRAPQPQLPSDLNNEYTGESTEPHVVETPTQQGAPQPGSGSTASGGGNSVPFKDQMIGYAKSIRGSVLRKPETKATGDKILNGEMSAKDYFEQKKQ